jgi:hypothetical protein
MPFHQPVLSARFLTLYVGIGAKPQALLKTDDRTISALRSLPPLSIDAFPHGMMSAHEMDAMAAIFGANVDGLRTRGQSCGNAGKLDAGGCRSWLRLHGSRLLRRRPQRGL